MSVATADNSGRSFKINETLPLYPNWPHQCLYSVTNISTLYSYHTSISLVSNLIPLFRSDAYWPPQLLYAPVHRQNKLPQIIYTTDWYILQIYDLCTDWKLRGNAKLQRRNRRNVLNRVHLETLSGSWYSMYSLYCRNATPMMIARAMETWW